MLNQYKNYTACYDMFRFTQEPSSGSSLVLSENYSMVFSVLVSIDVVNVMAAYQPVVRACVQPHALTTC